MSNVEKILQKWILSRPVTLNKNEVETVLIKYSFNIDKKRGSHWVVSHPALINKPNFGSLGEFSIPIKSGRKVKGVYRKEILEAISIVEEAGKL